MNQLKIHEMFTSIQGESTYAGLPCFFIRLAGCNLRWSYCDTLKAQTCDMAKEFTVDEVVSEAMQASPDLIEITGGEPMMQADAVCMLAERLLSLKRFRILMETNGSRDLSYLPDEVVRIVDYKTPSSGEAEKMFLPNFENLRPFDEVKFVLSDRDDYLFALEKIREFDLERQTNNILFSPAFGVIDIPALVAWMLEDKVKARLNLQFHKYIWGPAREGV